MADPSDFSISAQPSLQQLATFIVDELYAEHRIERLQNAMQNAHAKGAVTAQAATVAAGPSMGQLLEVGWEQSKDTAERAMGAALGWLVGEILGIEVSASELFHARRDPEQSAVGAAIADVAFKAIRGPAGELEPSDEGAKRLLGTLAHIITHCWAEGIILEKVEGYTSWSGHIEAITTLAKDLVNTLGLNRAARTAIRPLVRAVISTPLEWKTNKTYRPTLLPTGEILKAFQRGDYTGDEAAEELARLGYSNRRQDNLLKSAVQRLSLDEVLTLVRQGTLERGYALQNLRDEGYDEQTAQYTLVAAESKRIDAIRDNSLPALISAFVNRDIDESEFKTFLPAIVGNQLDQDAYITAAQTQQELNVKHLSHAEIRDCVELRILTRLDYRAWLKREGYPPADAAALELLLVKRLNDKADVEAERARLDADRAAEKAARDAAAAQRRADVEAERALHRRGSISDLERAVVRGLVPIARLEEVLRTQYDADTVDILVGLVEADRLVYVDQQQRAADARQRAGLRQIDVGALEAAVLANVLTLEVFRQQLQQRGFDAGDVDVLTATLKARKEDQDAAKRQRDEAARRAALKSIDLGRLETLVRRGHRTIADYAAQLRSLGYDEGAQAAMIDLLQLQIADDAAARQARAQLARERSTKSLTFDQHRRAVVLGIESIDSFVTFLVTDGYTADAQTVLVAELQHDVAEADAARQRREDAAAAAEAPGLPLATFARAARLGLIPPSMYQAALEQRGYSADDVALEMDLLVVEIADVQAARARRDELAQAAAAPALSLEQLRRGVLAGLATLDDYRGRAVTIGYGPRDVQLLSQLLEEELLAQTAARARRDAIEAELATRDLSLSELEALVKKGLLSLDEYVARVQELGYGSDDTMLLASLLMTALPGGGTGA